MNRLSMNVTCYIIIAYIVRSIILSSWIRIKSSQCGKVRIAGIRNSFEIHRHLKIPLIHNSPIPLRAGQLNSKRCSTRFNSLASKVDSFESFNSTHFNSCNSICLKSSIRISSQIFFNSIQLNS